MLEGCSVGREEASVGSNGMSVTYIIDPLVYHHGEIGWKSVTNTDGLSEKSLRAQIYRTTEAFIYFQIWLRFNDS